MKQKKPGIILDIFRQMFKEENFRNNIVNDNRPEEQMIQIYTTPEGFVVREGENAIDIEPGYLSHNNSLHVNGYVEDIDAKLIYTHYGPLKVGQDYPADAISPELGMVVMNTDTYEVLQYREWTDSSRVEWWRMGSAGTKGVLEKGTYKILYLGVKA